MNMENKRILCLTKGGSHAYGLSTPTSDTDYRGVFVNTDAAHLVGLKRDEILVEQNEQHDTVMTEFRHALRMLRGANTQMVELLYTDTFESVDPMWRYVQTFRQRLLDSAKLFSTLCGYMQGELRLANGERTGKLGGKRKEAIDKYGFSPKNFVQYFRLSWAGIVYFRKGYFPVNVQKENPEYAATLLEIKTQPQKYTRDGLNEMAANADANIKFAYDHRNHTTLFDEELVDNLCVQMYAPLIAAL